MQNILSLSEINYNLKSIFLSLNSNDLSVLSSYTLNIINHIYDKFNMNDIVAYRNELIKNDYESTIHICLLLLPYIMYSQLKELQNLTQITDILENGQEYNSNDKFPKFKYSNMRYDSPERQSYSINNDLAQNYLLLMVTLDKIKNKLYVNFDHIYPLTKSEILNLKEYKQKDYAEIYNVLTNQLYQNIKYIKWVIYDIDNQNLLLYFHSKYINLNELLNANNKLSSSEFTNKMNNLIDIFKQNNDQILNTILNTILYIYRNKTQKINTDLNDNLINKKMDYILNNNFNINDFYKYLQNTLFTLKTTYYSKFLFNTDHTQLISETNFNNDIHFNDLLDNNINVSLKNLYNFAKSLSHIKINNDFVFLGVDWNCLTEQYQNMIKTRFVNNNDRFWFNIYSYLKNYKFNGDDSYQQQIQAENMRIYFEIIDNIKPIVYDCLSYLGLLSGLKFNNNNNNNNNDNNDDTFIDYDIKIKQIINDYGNSYYFINNRPFNQFIDYKNIAKYKQNNILAWTKFFAMNWVAQIGFYNKYINNRISFLTVGTGIGKSIEVPKLLLYGLKMVDHNNIGKIACTQPRISPTIENSLRIAEEMFIPILSNNESTNPNIQISYSYKDNYSYVYDVPSLSLLTMTDGLLYAQMNKNPLLKYIIKDDNNENN